MRELRMVPKNSFSWDFRVLEGDQELTLLDRAWIREQGDFVLEGQTYRIRRQGRTGPWTLLDEQGRTYASAVKPSSFRRLFEVRSGDRRYTMKPAGPFTRRFQVLHQDRVVGEIDPESTFTRKTRMQLPDEVDTPSAILLGFLVTVIWKRQAQAAAGGG